MFRPEEPVGVAVSGGADSVFLLHALRELSPVQPLLVLHLNHQLRGAESDADAAFVADTASALGVPCEVSTANLGSIPDNLEQAGRRARLMFFRDVLARGEVKRVATGHTYDDQAETVLYRLLRGTGTQGLRGILPVTHEGIVRPLLDCRRSEIELWLRERGIRWREDSTNRDLLSPAIESGTRSCHCSRVNTIRGFETRWLGPRKSPLTRRRIGQPRSPQRLHR
jgi:tRNA(Ile)-lysidine synthase